MSNREDVIVTACILVSLALAVSAAPIAISGMVGIACLVFIAACYLVLLAMFVVAYVGRGDG